MLYIDFYHLERETCVSMIAYFTVDCQVGKYRESAASTCEICERGFYRSLKDDDCQKCPENYTTLMQDGVMVPAGDELACVQSK